MTVTGHPQFGRLLAGGSGAAVVLLPFLYALDPFRISSAWIVEEQFLAAMLGAALVFRFSQQMITAERQASRSVFLVFALVAALSAAAIIRHYASDSMLFIHASPLLMVVSGSLLALCLVASRYHGGWQMALMVLCFFVFGYVAQFLDGLFSAAQIQFDRYLVYMTFGGEGLLGRALRIISETVTIFVVFGIAFEISGGSDAIAAVALKAAKIGRGSAIKVTVLASGLFGTISGSATSNVLTSGSFSIPGMRKVGVPPATAGGIEAVASTCGQIMPPVMGAAAFLMSDLTAIPYGTIAVSAVIPAVLCYAVLFHQAEGLGRRIEAGLGAKEDPDFGDEPRYQIRASSLVHVLPAVGIIWVLSQNDTNSAGAGMVGTALALLIAFILRGPRRTVHHLVEIAPRAARTVANLVIAGATLGVVLAVMGSTGLDVKGALAISHVGEASLLLSLVMTAAAALVLGMGVSTSGVYLITGTLLAPGLVKLGVPLIAAHFFVFYCGMLSMITPPVAFAALAASGLVNASFRATAFEAMKFGWILFLLPFLIAYSPELLLVGDIGAVAKKIFAAVTFIFALMVFPKGRRLTMQYAAGLTAISAALSGCFPLLGGEAQMTYTLIGFAVSLILLLDQRRPDQSER